MSKLSYKALEKELIALKNNAISSSKELTYKEFFDNMVDMVDVIELIYNKNGQPIDFYIREINISFANFFGKTQEQLLNKKISSIVDIIEQHWFTSFASVDRTGEEIRFKTYGAAYDKFYHVTAWKVSGNRVGVSMSDITQTEKVKGKLKIKLEKEQKERAKTGHLLKEKRAELHDTIYNLNIANAELSFQNEEQYKRTNELAAVKVELEQQNSCLNKAAIVSETDANFNITFVNDNFCELYGYHREELMGQNHRILKSGKQPDAFFSEMISTISSGRVFKGEVLNKLRGGQLYWMDITIMPFKDLNGKVIKYVAIMFDFNSQTVQKEVLLKQADQLAIVNTKLAFQNEEKEKRADELAIANTELAFQNNEKEKRADELAIANTELAFQNKEKDSRADELAIANTELAFQNNEKEKRADELDIANKELAFQNEEKEKRADELAIANTELAFQNNEKEKRAEELVLANTELAFQNEEKEKRAEELAIANTELAFQNEEKEKRADELAIANTELAFQNKEKDSRADELAIANTELAFQNNEKEKRADELDIANKELAFQNEEKEKRADELAIANTELAFQNNEKEKRAEELVLANTELAFQNEEKEKRAEELAIANTELAFQNEEKEKRAEELVLANTELAFQNEEKEKRAEELAIANTELAFQNEEKEKRADELAIANTELAFQNKEKDSRADELAIANTELAFQNNEKEKRADELDIANKELAFQNEEKEKRADELAIANTELAFQNNEKEKRADELAIANTELAFQNKEKDNRADELILANKEKRKRADELVLANKEKEKRANELILANKELVFQTELDVYRSEMERVAHDLTLLIDTANAPIFGIDSKGLVNEWNQTSEKITGFTKNEVLGKDLVQTYITEDYRESVKKVLDDALLGQETENYEFPLFAKHGQRVMVLLNSSTRRDAKGKITGVLGVGQDISEIDKLRTASESIAKELRQFIETANAPIFGIDSEGLVNEWNQASESITGFTKDEVLEKDLVQTYITEDYRESVKKVLDDALLGKETANYEFPLFTKDGHRVMVLLNSSTRRDANGEITGVLGVGQDISEIDKLRTASESIAKELRQFIETANAPIFGIDSKGLVNEWNQTSESITGFTKDEVLGKYLVQTYITEDYRESVKKVLDDALLGKETANYEFPLFTKNGQRVMVLLNSSTRRDINGEIIGVLGVGQDITELAGYRNELELKVNERTLKLNQALEKQKELNELKSRFVSTASHEFRTPLSSINFAAGSIKKYWAKMEPIKIQKKLDKIEDQVLHMTKLLDDILIVGKAEAGKIIQTPVNINLGDFMYEIIDEVSSACKKSHDIVLIDTEGLKGISIFIDEKLGRNIFINIIGNAVKYSPDAKNITIALSSEKEYTVITITDYGIGVSKSELKNIFKPFSRGKNVDLIQGTGLGLTIAKDAIDVMGGKIIVKSTIRNGTSFIVKILKKQHV